MRLFKPILFIFAAAFLMSACSQAPTGEVENEAAPIGRVEESVFDNDNQFARENLDLQAVGGLLERADNAEDFEYLLNSEEGINNLDLNDDGYADYISVREFDDRSDDERGFSLYSMFGPELIQEIATIIFDRNGSNDGNYPGSRVLLRGDEDLYGDNYYYETNWLDRRLPIVDWVFNDRDGNYNSPYYYENYPTYYEPYETVEAPVYRTRVEQYYPTPVFIQRSQPTISRIEVVSPYKDKSFKKSYADLPRPTREEIEFRKNNRKSKDFERRPDDRAKTFSMNDDKRFKEDRKRPDNSENPRFDRPPMREKPNKPERFDVKPADRPRFDKQNQKRFERENRPKFERPQPMKPPKQEMRMPPNGNPNKGGGNPNKGGGNPNKGGGGKGKGKG